MATQEPIDFTSLSHRNDCIPRQRVEVANGAAFVALDLTPAQLNEMFGAIYIHVHRATHRCYIGITDQIVRKRWLTGTGYGAQRLFGRALRKYGWEEFDSYVLAFIDSREDLNVAEVKAIAAAGGHKSKFVFNLSPGGELVADNNIPLVGVNLATGEEHHFAGGSDAARIIGFGSSSTPVAVVRGEIHSAQGWWFRLASDQKSKPPEVWGKQYRDARMREAKARPVTAINFATGETRQFETIDDAAAALNAQQSEVWAVAHGKSHSAGGWWFKFVGDERAMPELHGAKAARAKRDRKIYATNLKTGEQREYRNCTVADDELGIYKGAAAMVASGERTSAAGWWFAYRKDAPPPTEYKSALVAKARSKAVIATDITTGKVKRYDSAKAAAAELGMSRAAISKSIKNGGTPTMGYSFAFALKASSFPQKSVQATSAPPEVKTC